MSTQFNTIMSNAITAIGAEIAVVEGELDRLTEAKNTLESLVNEATTEKAAKKATRSPDEPPAANVATKVTTKVEKPKSKREVKALTDGSSTQRGRIMAMLDAGMTPKDIAEALDTHVSYVYTVKKARAEQQAQPVSRSAKKANGNGNSNGHSNGDNQSQADKIRELLAQDVSVADIAKRLNTHPSYVYTVKNR